MFKKILVTLDGSELSEMILPHVRTLCEDSDASVVLLRIADIDDGVSYVSPDLPAGSGTGGVATQARETVDQRITRIEDEILTYLQDRATVLQGAVSAVETEVLFSDKIPESIVEYAKGADIDAIMMSTHGRTGLASVILGSVASKVMRACHLPVLLVCPRYGTPSRPSRDES